METFFTSNVGASLLLSEYSNIPLPSSTALSFQRKGYETSYYTGGYTGWRNTGKYCRTQGFENVHGAEFMKSLYPQIEEADWGVFDQYMFDALFQKLQEKKKEPQFFLCMTITNHSPHKIPKNYQLYPIEFPESLLPRITSDLTKTLKIMQTFQYANDCLGNFIHNLRNADLGNNTIVVITGDHSMTGGFTYQDNALLYQWAVPLMFYIPVKYTQALQIDTTRLVSHKDILPTIYNLAFSDYTYCTTGDNIFDSTTTENAFVITQSSWVMGKPGVVNLRNSSSYTWENGSYYLQPQELSPELAAIKKRANAWLFGMKWQIFSEVTKK
jgi:phosphoglycerol transferase MdoB-like AlkP superfamily enzyme